MNQQLTVADNRKFFDGVYQEVWRRMIPQGLTEAEVAFIEDVCGLKPGAAVLDLMCGYGRHALALARRGYSVQALDSAEGYIREIQAAVVAEGLPLDARQVDVADYQPEGSFQAAICMGNSFAFFDEASVHRVLTALNRVLVPGARFVINTWMIGEIAYRHFQERVWHQVDEYKYLIESRFLMQPSRIEAEHTIVGPTGKVESIQGVDYIFTIAEMERMLQENGFDLQDVFYTPRKRPFQLGDNKAYIVVVKR